MLVAMLEGDRVIASLAQKGPTYFCPGCKQEVTLKKGRKVIHHFAHKPPVTCSWSVGETQAHLKAKALFHEFFTKQGYVTELEFPMEQCRADVYVSGMAMIPVVFEVQHTTIPEDEIVRRTRNYFSQGVAMNWFPLINIEKLKNRQSYEGRYLIERYAPKRYERWLHGFNFGEIWYFDTSFACFWQGKFSPYEIDVPYSSWYGPGGGERSAGGYRKILKRYKNLSLYGPFRFNDVRFSLSRRQSGSFSGYSYPGGYQVKLIPNGIQY